MAMMTEKCSPMRRILALALPLCLAWTLVGCVFVCASHIESAAHKDEPSCAALTPAPHDDDCCPIVVSTGVRSEKLSIDVGSGIINAQLLAPEKSLLPPGIQSRTFTPAYSPPFTRLCTLRI